MIPHLQLEQTLITLNIFVKLPEFLKRNGQESAGTDWGNVRGGPPRSAHQEDGSHPQKNHVGKGPKLPFIEW